MSLGGGTGDKPKSSKMMPIAMATGIVITLGIGLAFALSKAEKMYVKNCSGPVIAEEYADMDNDGDNDRVKVYKRGDEALLKLLDGRKEDRLHICIEYNNGDKGDMAYVDKFDRWKDSTLEIALEDIDEDGFRDIEVTMEGKGPEGLVGSEMLYNSGGSPIKR